MREGKKDRKGECVCKSLTCNFLSPSSSYSSIIAMALAFSSGEYFCTVGRMSAVGASPRLRFIPLKSSTGRVMVPSMSKITPSISVSASQFNPWQSSPVDEDFPSHLSLSVAWDEEELVTR